MKKREIFDTLFKLAIATEKTSNSKIASGIFLRNKPISFGFNEKKSHPFQKRFGKNEECIYLHSETSAIKNALKILHVEELKDCTIYTVRVKQPIRGADFVAGSSKPCVGCQRAIATFSINKTYYTEDCANVFSCL